MIWHLRFCLYCALALQINWSGSGNLVCITSEDSFYILRFDRDAYNTALDSGADLGDEGVEEAFDMVAEVPEPYVVFKPDI